MNHCRRISGRLHSRSDRRVANGPGSSVTRRLRLQTVWSLRRSRAGRSDHQYDVCSPLSLRTIPVRLKTCSSYVPAAVWTGGVFADRCVFFVSSCMSRYLYFVKCSFVLLKA